ncbi:hypothetical protein JYU14_00700 [Simkania negevensis]|uniref:Uncharacterized protein n=1 Tax=Simkania negevensis TaxID=83561 RepID=A0ABS3APJ5_9BACT|nr:hypothetical protein [Simkania negevensis]
MPGEILFTGGLYQTKKGLSDNTRPAAMVDADKIFEKYIRKAGANATDTLLFIRIIADELIATRMSNIDTLWARIEKVVNRGDPLDTKAVTDEEKVHTALSFFYNVLDIVDMTKNTRQLMGLKEGYIKTRNRLESRLLPNMDTKAKRVLQRIIKTIDVRMDKMIDNFNDLIDQNIIAGPKIATAEISSF